MIEEKLFKKYLLLLPQETRESDVLDDECKLLLGVLASWWRSTGSFSPSVSMTQLSALTNTSKEEVVLNLSILEGLDLIDIRHSREKGVANSYDLHTWNWGNWDNLKINYTKKSNNG